MNVACECESRRNIAFEYIKDGLGAQIGEGAK